MRALTVATQMRGAPARTIAGVRARGQGFMGSTV